MSCEEENTSYANTTLRVSIEDSEIERWRKNTAYKGREYYDP